MTLGCFSGAVVSVLEALCDHLEQRWTDYISDTGFLLCVMVMCKFFFFFFQNNLWLRVGKVLHPLLSMK